MISSIKLYWANRISNASIVNRTICFICFLKKQPRNNFWFAAGEKMGNAFRQNDIGLSLASAVIG